MIEKVNPCHPDKVADRIAGAIVDLAYILDSTPKIAVEVLIGHGLCTIIAESNVAIKTSAVKNIVTRIAGKLKVKFSLVAQDINLAKNQNDQIRCGDNGIFLGLPLSNEEKKISKIAKEIYAHYPTDGKYILDGKKLIICQSNADAAVIKQQYQSAGFEVTVNPLGAWTGGINVDSGATNRKLGSDMGHSVTGGGLHGKDLSKSDVSVNIYAFLQAQKTGKPVEISCAIGDTVIDGKPYIEIVEIAKKYIFEVMGGFENFAAWGLF